MITAFERAFDFTSYLLPIQYCRRPIQYPTNQLLTFSIHVKNKIIKNLFLNVVYIITAELSSVASHLYAEIDFILVSTGRKSLLDAGLLGLISSSIFNGAQSSSSTSQPSPSSPCALDEALDEGAAGACRAT